MQKYEEFEVSLTKLGSEPNLSENLFKSLEEYTALLYGVKSKSINEARWKIFEKNIRGINKSSIYPYCLLAKVFWGSTVKEQNAFAYQWRNASNPTIEFPSLTENGWTTTGDIEWIEEAIPAEVGGLITRDEDNGENEDDYVSDMESSDDEDYDHVFWSLKTVFLTGNLAKF